MQNKKQTIIFILLIIAVFCIIIYLPGRKTFISSSASQDVISINLANKQVVFGQDIVATINLNTQGQSVNAVGIIVNFDPHQLTIGSVDTSSSFCTLYADRAYNAQKGFIKLYCGKPRPGFSGSNVLETITFKSLTYGKSAISIDPKSLVLQNNGKATNLLKHFDSEPISVILSE